MKHIILSIALFSTTTVNAGQQSYAWVTTPFWKAPQVSKLDLQVKSLNSDLEKVCQSYRKLIFNNKGEPNLTDEPETIQRFRTTAMNFNESTFKASFYMPGLNNNGELEILLNVSNSELYGRPLDSAEILPRYTQMKSSSNIGLAQMKEFNMTTLPGSLTEASRLSGLQDSKISVTKNFRSDLIVTFEGKDVACDFLEGKIKLESKAYVDIFLPIEESKFMLGLYKKDLPKILEDVMKAKETNSVKTARLGFRIGKLIDSLSNDANDETTELQLKNLMERLFINDSLELSSNVLAPMNYAVSAKFSAKGSDALVNIRIY